LEGQGQDRWGGMRSTERPSSFTTYFDPFSAMITCGRSLW